MMVPVGRRARQGQYSKESLVSVKIIRIVSLLLEVGRAFSGLIVIELPTIQDYDPGNALSPLVPYAAGAATAYVTRDPRAASWVTWGTQQIINFITGKPIRDKWLGIDIINPPSAQ